MHASPDRLWTHLSRHVTTTAWLWGGVGQISGTKPARIQGSTTARNFGPLTGRRKATRRAYSAPKETSLESGLGSYVPVRAALQGCASLGPTQNRSA